MSQIDPSLYVRAPVADVAGAVALGISLLSALPKGAPKPVKEAGTRLRKSVVSLQAAWAEAAVPATPAGRRAADAAADTGWGALEGRLASYARLPVSKYPGAARAAEIHLLLFPTGLDFLTFPYRSQWAESARRLQLVATKELAADIDDLAGPEFLAEVKRTHKLYGEVLRVTKAEELPPEVRLTEPLRAVGASIVDLALQLLAHAAADPSAETAVRKALKPIDDHRAASRRAPAGAAPGAEEEGEGPAADTDVTPKTPVPDVPA